MSLGQSHGETMLRTRRNSVKLLVWVMIPITLAIGQPRMECLRARAEGKLFCNCPPRIVRQQTPVQTAESCCGSLAPQPVCCTDSALNESPGDSSPGSRRCCEVSVITLGIPPDLTSVVDAAASSVGLAPDAVFAYSAPNRLERLSWQIHSPPLDRVTVFCHLVI